MKGTARKRETAGGLLPFNNGLAPDAPKQFAPDNLLIDKGNVGYRMQDLLRRRHNASLAGQHRTVQRLDKELQLLRSALGMDPDPPPEITRTHRNGKDPTNGENLMISSTASVKKGEGRLLTEDEVRAAARKKTTASEIAPSQQGKETVEHEGFTAAQMGRGHNTCPHPYDSVKRDWWQAGHNRYHNVPAPEGYQFKPQTDLPWAKKVTAKNLATAIQHFDDAGYTYHIKKDGAVATHTWDGFVGPQKDSWSITVLGREWAVAAVRNGARLPIFAFTESDDIIEQGIPIQITAATWDGRLDAKTKQTYVAGWAHILREIRR